MRLLIQIPLVLCVYHTFIEGNEDKKNGNDASKETVSPTGWVKADRPWIKLRKRRSLGEGSALREAYDGKPVTTNTKTYDGKIGLMKRMKKIDSKADPKANDNLKIMKKLWLLTQMDGMQRNLIDSLVHSRGSRNSREDSRLAQIAKTNTVSQKYDKRNIMNQRNNERVSVIQTLNKLDESIERKSSKSRSAEPSDEHHDGSLLAGNRRSTPKEEWVKERAQLLDRFLDLLLDSESSPAESNMHENKQKENSNIDAIRNLLSVNSKKVENAKKETSIDSQDVKSKRMNYKQTSETGNARKNIQGSESFSEQIIDLLQKAYEK